MTQGEPADAELDARGYHCPLPALKARRALQAMPSGSVLHLMATDPMAAIDIPHFCQEQGHTLLATWQETTELHFRIRRKP